MGAVNPITPTVWPTNTHTHTHTVHHSTPLLHSTHDLHTYTRRLKAHLRTLCPHKHLCADCSSCAPDYHHIPCSVRVSQQQHVQQGVWNSLHLIKACKHRRLHTARHFKAPMLCVALLVGCKFPFQMLEQTLWTSIPILPLFSVFLPIYFLCLDDLHISLQLVYCDVNPFCSYSECRLPLLHALHPFALPECNQVLEKALHIYFLLCYT